ncbi:KH domain-containing protein [Aphelenchoides besseyi]|nr:KH domain-containing protein [Aphelenchoides besseyi]
MDVLNAHRYRLDYAIYRRNVPVESVVFGERGGKVQFLGRPIDEEAEEDQIEEAQTSQPLTEHSEVISTYGESEGTALTESSNNYVVSLNPKLKMWTAITSVPSAFMGIFIGTGFANLRKIESSTDCKIELPKKGTTSTSLTIKSRVGRENVERCLDQIEMFVLRQRERAKPTHFISLPLLSEEVIHEYENFKLLIKNSESIPTESKRSELFTPVPKLHVTLCTLILLSEDEINRAREEFKEVVKNEILPLLKDQSLVVNAAGLSHFGDEDPRVARVLYAKLIGLKLPEITDRIYQHMLSRGFAKKETRKTQLHMTLMNTRYMAEAGLGETFDAAAILDLFSNYQFGSAQIDQINMSLMGEVDSKTGSHPIVQSVELP